MQNLKISTTVILSILATGAALSFASNSNIEPIKKFADYIINGYGK